ncbi:uncharacterized protein F5Z01DRAFT_650073 [Emericellopsis atlantica]|uniref:Phenylalanine--tRNA ligase, mitochondrial n=1 Tax=Emericellopsis atlantica TaxID=2614577 RepID=A0A9P7ZRB2_9HYPO|nr:uncharacterized protein F5Z01DRAFT_650073 [Emericellopsis atlantica]KAG9256401.1 hypothetical protein F5Z01DRAFT_650073 [Emericellopsis atlantica]
MRTQLASVRLLTTGVSRGVLRIRPAYASRAYYSSDHKKNITIQGTAYETDPKWFNVPSAVADATSRQLHLQKDHPISITRQIIESSFPTPTFKYHRTFSPVVSTHQNFDSLGFPKDHVGRAKSDTYYINETTLLRTHTSAHQADTFRADESDGYLIAADVYRRDAIDASHYPVFHQMEGAMSWDRTKVPDGDVAKAVWKDVEKLPKHNIKVEDPQPAWNDKTNPIQDKHHSVAEVEAIGCHLKRSLEAMVVDLFTRAKSAALKANPDFVDEPLQMRWVEAYFPFTSPSWELEVYYAGDWLEVLGCGVVKQDLYINAGVPHKLGWAFGLGIDRLAMLLFKISDIRLFWSQDPRFLSQFTGVSDSPSSLSRFVPFSKYPPALRDVSFWLPKDREFHENDFMEVIRSIGGDAVEEVKLFDSFTHPKTGEQSRAYNVVYRSWDRTFTKEEANELHEQVRAQLIEKLGLRMR